MSVTQQESLEPELIGPNDRARFWRDPRHGGMECLHAQFVKHVYAPHIHDTYVFGVICRGVELFTAGGVSHRSVPGQALILNPGVLHDGRPADGGYEYRMFYPGVDLLQEIAADMTGRPCPPPFFRDVVLDDPELYRRTLLLHRVCEAPGQKLHKDTLLVDTLALLIARHGDLTRRPLGAGRETARIARLRDHIEDRLDIDAGLDDLAAVAGVSRFHLIRCFKREMGVTPHAYVTSRRVARAKTLLGRGADLADTALACGFFDQSHFSRVFKNTIGVTPGQYRRATAPEIDRGGNILQEPPAAAE